MEIDTIGKIRQDKVLGHIQVEGEKNVYNPLNNKLEKQPTITNVPVGARVETVGPVRTYDSVSINAQTGNPI